MDKVRTKKDKKGPKKDQTKNQNRIQKVHILVEYWSYFGSKMLRAFRRCFCAVLGCRLTRVHYQCFICFCRTDANCRDGKLCGGKHMCDFLPAFLTVFKYGAKVGTAPIQDLWH